MTENRVSIVGVGRAGRAWAWALAECTGWRVVGGWSRGEVTAQVAREALGLAVWTGEETLAEATQGAEVVLLAVVDDALAAMAASLAAVLSAEQVVLHLSGSVSSKVLEVEGMAAACGSLHPLKALTGDQASGDALTGAFMAIEGDARAVARARQLAAAVGGRAVSVRREGKGLYHAGAVMMSNYLVTLFDGALGMLTDAGLAREDAVAMLQSLARGTLDNLARTTPEAALTGPVRRGDVTTVEGHFTVMNAQQARLYVGLLEATIDLAVRAGLAVNAAEALRGSGGEKMS